MALRQHELIASGLPSSSPPTESKPTPHYRRISVRRRPQGIHASTRPAQSHSKRSTPHGGADGDEVEQRPPTMFQWITCFISPVRTVARSTSKRRMPRRSRALVSSPPSVPVISTASERDGSRRPMRHQRSCGRSASVGLSRRDRLPGSTDFGRWTNLCCMFGCREARAALPRPMIAPPRLMPRAMRSAFITRRTPRVPERTMT